MNDVKRQLNECGIEKEKYLLSNKELRDFIKKSEAEKREQARSLEESHQRIAGTQLHKHITCVSTLAFYIFLIGRVLCSRFRR